MPKSKLKSHHNGHALSKGKNSVYQRCVTKREEERAHHREEDVPPSPMTEMAADLATDTPLPPG